MRAFVLAAMVAAFACAGPAQAANGWWTFERISNTNSTLTWKWTYPPSPTQYTRSWRAGSGTTQNECRRAEGWLPVGWYSQWGHWNHYDGSSIRGRVWWLQDKYCWDGVTKRTELFIHSEETASNGQSCTSAYDDPFCWERAADYYSLGCIKLARPSPVADFPNDLGNAHSVYHSYGGSTDHGAFSDAYELYVFD
ncbi:MAG TPA: hypothetical protein VGJ49_00505 [Gaiellaceae bacterium]